MTEYNTLSTDLNREVSDYCRLHRHRIPTSELEWWRITRHLELTCQHVLWKLRGDVRRGSRGSRRNRTSSSGNINQTLFDMSMGCGAPSTNPNSNSLTRQQLAVVRELKVLSERVLDPKQGKVVKVGNIIRVFYKIKQKFEMDRYERQILDYGVETMREAINKELPIDSQEVVRCLQEICDLVKQMAIQQNPLRPMTNLPVKEVPSLLDIEVRPPIRSRLFSNDVAAQMTMTFNCLMDLYRNIDTSQSDTDTEPAPSTSAASDEGDNLHQEDHLSPESETNITFPCAIESCDVAHLPVINTFGLGTTYDYSKIENESGEKDKALLKDELDGEIHENLQGDDPDNSKSPNSPEANDVSDNLPSSADFCPKVDSENNVSPDEENFDATKVEPSANGCGERHFTVKSEEDKDSEVNSLHGNDEVLHPDGVKTTPIADKSETIVQAETNSDENTCGTTSEIPTPITVPPSMATENSGADRESGNNESEGTVNQEQYQESHREQCLENISEYMYPTEQDYTSTTDSNYMQALYKIEPSHQESQAVLEHSVDYTVQEDTALDLSLRKGEQDKVREKRIKTWDSGFESAN